MAWWHYSLKEMFSDIYIPHTLVWCVPYHMNSLPWHVISEIILITKTRCLDSSNHFYMYVCFACMHIWAPYACQVATECRSRNQRPWNKKYKQLIATFCELGLEYKSSTRATNVLTTKPFLQVSMFYFCCHFSQDVSFGALFCPSRFIAFHSVVKLYYIKMCVQYYDLHKYSSE